MCSHILHSNLCGSVSDGTQWWSHIFDKYHIFLTSMCLLSLCFPVPSIPLYLLFSIPLCILFLQVYYSSVPTVHLYLLFLHTVLCKSNANDNRRISCFVLAIYRRYISKTLHGLPNVKTINHRDISTIFAISPRDIVLARLHCNDISQSGTIYHHDISLQRSSL